MPEARYRKNTGSVSNLNYHFVWCVKYRRNALVEGIAERLKELIAERADVLNLEIAGLEVMPDHVHLFFSAPPTDAPQFYANQFKGYTSRVLREEFPQLKSSLPSLWSRSYYVGSAAPKGYPVSADVIRKYIENQKGRG